MNCNDFQSVYYTDKGGRTINEDCVKIVNCDHGILGLVADGLGGHGSGDIASQNTCNVISSFLMNGEYTEDILYDAIEEAHKELLKIQTNGIHMKTTIAVLWIKDKSAFVAHVGDTRIYQIRDNEIIFQSIDHSMSQVAVMLGKITFNQIRGHEDRNQLYRAVGSEQPVRPEVKSLSIQSGDIFLLCTDGFWENVWEDEMISSIKSGRTVDEYLSGMRGYVTRRLTKTSDNYSALLVKII